MSVSWHSQYHEQLYPALVLHGELLHDRFPAIVFVGDVPDRFAWAQSEDGIEARLDEPVLESGIGKCERRQQLPQDGHMMVREPARRVSDPNGINAIHFPNDAFGGNALR